MELLAEQTQQNADNTKSCYRFGARVKLTKLAGEQIVLSGTEGTVIKLSEDGKVYVEWDNGKGDTVMMNSEYLAKDEHKTKIWTVCSEPFVIGRTACVMLDGFSGYYATDRLTVVNEEVS